MSVHASLTTKYYVSRKWKRKDIKSTEKNHRPYVDEIVLLVQVNFIFMTSDLIEEINLLNSISLCITHYQ